VYRCGADGVPEFVEVAAPTDDEAHALLQAIITRLMKPLTRRGVLVQDARQTYLAEPDADGEEARTLRPLQAAAITYRIAFGPRARCQQRSKADPLLVMNDGVNLTRLGACVQAVDGAFFAA
jgi:hypothetical protein